MLQNSQDGPLVLMTFTHSLLTPDPLRLALGSPDVVSRGETFYGTGFDVKLPDESDRSIPRARLFLFAGPSLLLEKLAATSERAAVLVEAVSWVDKDTVMRAWNHLTMRSVTSAGPSLDIVLSGDDLWKEPLQKERFTNDQFTLLD